MRVKCFFIDLHAFNIINVEKNYISQIIHFERDRGEELFNIVSITSFHVDKGVLQTRNVKNAIGKTIEQRYRVLKVTEYKQNYQDNEPYGEPVIREYEKEEIVE